MKIGFDAKRAFHNTTGLGNYSRGVIESLSKFFPQHEYVLFTPYASGILIPDARNCSVVTPPAFWKIFHSAWRTSKIISHLKKNNIQIYHGLSNEIPFGINNSGVKSVVTIHDLIFLHHPEFYSVVNRNIYQRKSLHACKKADHIIAVSEQTKSDIITFYGIEEEKISVIRQSIAPVYFEERVSVKYNEPEKNLQLPEKFLLYVGTVEERKNLLAVVKALENLESHKDLKLVVVGRTTAYQRKVDDYTEPHNLRNRIVFLNDVSNEELQFIYQSASVLVYPSHAEGFGLPIAEALASGTPVIANDEKIFREAGGENSVYINVNDAENFASAIAHVLEDDVHRKKMIEQGKDYANNFRAEKHAIQIMNLYEKILMQ